MKIPITLPKFNKKERQKIILGAMASVVLAMLYWQYFLKPTWQDIDKKQARYTELKNKIAELKFRSARMEALKIETQELETFWQSLEAKLPKERALPKILDTITRLAQKNHLELVSLSPQGVRPETLYTEHSFGLSLVGSYHNIASFVTDLGRAQRLFHSRDLTMSSRSGGDPATSVNATITVIAFEYKGG